MKAAIINQFAQWMSQASSADAAMICDAIKSGNRDVVEEEYFLWVDHEEKQVEISISEWNQQAIVWARNMKGEGVCA